MSPHCVIRRHGEVLREAVLTAAIEEIAENGVAGASMDRIARRAGTGKAALYRRWSNVRALALDAIVTTLEGALPAAMIDTGSLRDDVITSMDLLTSQLRGDLGVVVRALISEAAHDPEVAAQFTERFGMRIQLAAVAQIQRATDKVAGPSWAGGAARPYRQWSGQDRHIVKLRTKRRAENRAEFGDCKRRSPRRAK